MTDTQLDMNAIQQAAAAALAAPADPVTSAVLEAHQCQTGCGRIANVILVRIADSDLDILCDVCAMMLYLSVADSIQMAEPVDQPAEPVDTEATQQDTP